MIDKDKEKDNRVNALAMTFLEELQMRPNLFADQILRAYKTGYYQSEKDSLHSEPVRKIWHDTSEEPRLEEEVLVLRNNGTVTQVKTYQNNFGKNEYCDGMILWKLSEQKAWCYLDDLIHEKEEPVSEELEKAAIEYCGGNKGSDARVRGGFLAGAQWQKENLWKPADGNDLPDIDREVISLLDNGRVVFAHRPPEYWDGKDIVTGKVTRNYPKTYDKGGWNIPDIVYWLDVDLPKREG